MVGAYHPTSLNPSSLGRTKHTNLRDQQGALCQALQLRCLTLGQKRLRKMKCGRSAGQGARVPFQ